jgi:membrane protein DedA with SNARE-associated domain
MDDLEKDYFVETVTNLLQQTNPLLIYCIVATALLLESSGVPVLNSTLLLFTGALASSGYLNIWYLAFAAIAGSITGACLAYYLGARGGRKLLLHLARRFRIDTEKISIVEHWFQKSGIWMIFFSRMTPYVRPFACFTAGITHTHFTRFFMSASSGSLLWCSIALTAGWILGSRWELAVVLLQEYTIPALCGIALLIGAYLLARHLLKNYLRKHFRPSPAAGQKRDLIEV